MRTLGNCRRVHLSFLLTRRCGICAAALRVIVYQGQSQSAGIGGGRQSAGPVTPRDLAAADVCITTYDVLRRDLNHRPDDGAVEHALRRRKKYEVGAACSACGTSPVPCLHGHCQCAEPSAACCVCLVGTRFID